MIGDTIMDLKAAKAALITGVGLHADMVKSLI